MRPGVRGEKHSLPCSVVLQLPDAGLHPDVPLQALIIRWHEDQGRLQALLSQPQLVCLQLARGLRHHTKSSTRISWETTRLMMPTFQGQGCTVDWRPYCIRAAVEHQGSSAASGHYVAKLFSQQGMWTADDGMCPQLEASLQPQASDVSLVWLTPSHPGDGTEQVERPRGAETRMPLARQTEWQNVIGRFF